MFIVCVFGGRGGLKSTNVQEKLDFEMRMREGAYKLLLACTKREQVLNASKNVMTCNARIKAYLAQLQTMRDQQDATGALARSVDVFVFILLFFFL